MKQKSAATAEVAASGAQMAAAKTREAVAARAVACVPEAAAMPALHCPPRRLHLQCTCRGSGQPAQPDRLDLASCEPSLAEPGPSVSTPQALERATASRALRRAFASPLVLRPPSAGVGLRLQPLRLVPKLLPHRPEEQSTGAHVATPAPPRPSLVERRQPVTALPATPQGRWARPRGPRRSGRGHAW